MRSEIKPDKGESTIFTLPSRQITVPVLKQREIRIRDARNYRLVTAIEVLSPSNKTPSGSSVHVNKLRNYWNGSVNTIDIDLLRGGSFPYEDVFQLYPEDKPAADYHVLSVIPEGNSSVWDFGVLDELPTIPVPLIYFDQPLVLDLQKAFDELYVYSTYPRRSAKELERLQPELKEKNWRFYGKV